MKAVLYHRYGGPEVLQMGEVAKPQPADNEVLIRIHASAVNAADWRLRKADPFLARLVLGLFKPKQKILGVVMAGVVEATGKSVTKFKIGDEVFGLPEMKLNAYAEYACYPESIALARKPNTLTFEEAAAIPFGAQTAQYFLKKANLKAGEHILIYGASGAVGSAAVQLANHFGAHITAVCSGRNAALVKSLGAHQVIDYTVEDFTANGQRYDVVFDTVNKVSAFKLAAVLKKNGRLILGSALGKQLLQGIWISLTTKKKIIGGTTFGTGDSMNEIRELVEQGILKPVIDRTYLFGDTAEAHRYVEQGHKRGNVVLTWSNR